MLTVEKKKVGGFLYNPSFFICQIAQKKWSKTSKMKKNHKITKNFQKGYLQMDVYVVNYGKKLKGVFWVRLFFYAQKHEKPSAFPVQFRKI